MESYGWTGTQLNMWSETSVFLPVGILTLLWAIFVMPRMLPDQPSAHFRHAENSRDHKHGENDAEQRHAVLPPVNLCRDGD